jgi:hypothetical protein
MEMEILKIEAQENIWLIAIMVIIAIVSVLCAIRQINLSKRYAAERKAEIAANHTYEAVIRRNARNSFTDYCDQSAAEDFLDEVLSRKRA